MSPSECSALSWNPYNGWHNAGSPPLFRSASRILSVATLLPCSLFFVLYYSQVAYREKQRTLHFTYGLNTRGDNFDPNHPMNLEAEKNASSSSFLGAGGASSSFSSPSTRQNLSGEQEGERDAMPRHVLKSQRAAAGDCSYAVGILKQDKLFITPVDHVLQFRPDFSQVDRLAQSQQASRTAPHASGPKAASGTGVAAAGVGGDTESGAEIKGSGRGGTEDERSDEKTKGAGAGVTKGGDEAGKGKHGGLVGGSGPGISAGGGTMSAGQGRTRMSHSKQRDVEESEEWLPVEVCMMHALIFVHSMRLSPSLSSLRAGLLSSLRTDVRCDCGLRIRGF